MTKIPHAALLALAVSLAPELNAQTSLRGSKSSVNRMYDQAVDHKLKFHRTGKSVDNAAKAGTLVRLSANNDFRLSGVRYPRVLPSTRSFVQRLGGQYRAKCGEKMVVTSGLRPESYRLVNGNPKSVHPTGMAIDLRKPRNSKCLKWLRETLLYVEGKGAIEATEERNPPHFHVAVFPGPYTRYVAGRSSGKDEASSGEEKVAEASSSTRYKVRRGDNLTLIARRHGVTVKEIQNANGLKSARIRAGQTLRIPDGE